MRTETVTYQIFSLGDLSPEARARAYRKWLNDEPEYGWNAENKQTLNAFCDLLGIRCNKWEYDGYSYSFSWYSPYEDTIENLHGARLAAYLHNNFGSHLFVPKIYYKGRRRRRSRLFCTTECPLTGYYMDNMILDPIYCFFTHPDDTTFYDLIECCLDTFFRACRDDARYCRSEEYFAELAESNAWEYLASGTAYHLIN